MRRLERLAERRIDPMVEKAQLLTEAYRRMEQSEAIRYAIGAMQPIDPEYTANTFSEGDRVKNQLATRLTAPREFRYQGSTSHDTHIKARSDIDLLVLRTDWIMLKLPLIPEAPYSGDIFQDMRDMRGEAETAVATAFPKAKVDTSGGKAIVVDGGSLRRTVDVVPAVWLDTEEYLRDGDETYRGVEVFDRGTSTFIPNYPFLFNARIEQKDRQTAGGMRKAARLMKSLKYDSEGRLTMSSYNIVSIAWNMPKGTVAWVKPYELAIVEGCWLYCQVLKEDPIQRASLDVPDGSRKVFGGDAGATVAQLDQLTAELTTLRTDIAHENARSFTKLYEARVDY